MPAFSYKCTYEKLAVVFRLLPTRNLNLKLVISRCCIAGEAKKYTKTAGDLSVAYSLMNKLTCLGLRYKYVSSDKFLPR